MSPKLCPLHEPSLLFQLWIWKSSVSPWAAALLPPAGLPAEVSRTGAAKETNPGGSKRWARLNQSPIPGQDGGSSFKLPCGWRARKVISSLTSGRFPAPRPLPFLCSISSGLSHSVLTGLGAQGCICSLHFGAPSGRRGRVAGKARESLDWRKKLCLLAAGRQGIFTSPTMSSRQISKGKPFDNSPPPFFCLSAFAKLLISSGIKTLSNSSSM